MDKKDFRRLSKRKKYDLLRNKGKILGSRTHAGFTCFLYSFGALFIEVWKPIGINLIQWIEVVNSDEIVANYLDQIDWKDIP